jgi:glyoxylase-like metal-dependent hydrolase (beta-lactamase superfamily II)
LIPLGDLRLDLVTAGHFCLDGGAMFGVVPRVLWERVSRPDERNRIELALNCLLIRDGKRTVLVETGMGEKWRSKERDIYHLRNEGGLPAALRPLGVLPESVDTVILTHLHFDHAGGATAPGAGGDAVPAFPNATYVVQATEWEFAHHLNERTRASYLLHDYDPLQRAGQLRLVEGELEILPGVKLVPLPGHTPGMQGVLARGGGRAALYPSDLVPTVSHLPYPYIMGYDVLPLTTLETRKRVFPQAAGEGWILILGHECRTPVGTLREEGSRFRLEPWEEEA